MTPELRSWYLSNLGIVQYVSKGEESAALPFHSVPDASSEGINQGDGAEIAGTAKEIQNTLNTDPSNQHQKAQVANVLELVGEKSGAPLTEALLEPELESGSAMVNDKANTSESPLLSFRLACWHPCDDMLVFNQLLPGEQPDRNQNLLLSNILKAIGRLPNGLPAPELFDWPMDNVVGKHVDHSESGAKDMLSVFLDARIKKYGVLWVLLMGELPSVLLFPQERFPTELTSTDNKLYADLLGQTEEIAGGAQIIVLRSLQEILDDPGFKAGTWQAIRHLAE